MFLNSFTIDAFITDVSVGAKRVKSGNIKGLATNFIELS